jgi:hypothetical protein
LLLDDHFGRLLFYRDLRRGLLHIDRRRRLLNVNLWSGRCYSRWRIRRRRWLLRSGSCRPGPRRKGAGRHQYRFAHPTLRFIATDRWSLWDHERKGWPESS